MPHRRSKLGEKGLLEEARRLNRGGGGSGGNTKPHALLGTPTHNDTVSATPSEGALVLANSTPDWDILSHPAAAGYAMVTDATTWTIDQTPTWTGDHTWDDGDGDSPANIFITQSDDQFSMWAENDATPGNSDFVVKFPAADADSLFLFRDSGDSDNVAITADGHVGIATTSPNARLEVEDGGTTEGVLVKITADDNHPWGLVIGNDTASATDTHGIRFYVDNDGTGRIDARGAGDENLVFQADGGNVGISATSPLAQLHVDQSSASGAQPVLLLDQGDVSEQHIKLSINGADQDFPAIIELDVTGAPTYWWDESEDAFSQTHDLILEPRCFGFLKAQDSNGRVGNGPVEFGEVVAVGGTMEVAPACALNAAVTIN